MRDDILTASLRVLRREGALKFTTPRVAEAAGISVGSLYQYFPNKQALVFALHSRTVEQAWVEVQRVLDQPALSPREKVRRIARLFFVSESAEVAELGAALQDAELFFASQPEERELEARVYRRFRRFVRDALPPRAPPAQVSFSTALLITVLESTGRAAAARGLKPREAKRWADHCTDMLVDHLGLHGRGRLPAKRSESRARSNGH